MALGALVCAFTASADTYQCTRGWWCTETEAHKNPITWMSANFWTNLTLHVVATRRKTGFMAVVY